MQAISIGEVLWDIVGTSELLGGAPFNFALHLHNLGHRVQFISAVGSDERGQRVLARMRAAGLVTDYVAEVAEHPTGTASVVLDEKRQPRFVINHPAAYDRPRLSEAEIERLCGGRPELIYFGTLFQMSLASREVTFQLLAKCPQARRFYDVNLRPNSYEPDLVVDLMERASVVKVSEEEVTIIRSMFSDKATSLEQFCRDYMRKFAWEAVCVTRGADGCVLLRGDRFVVSRGYQVPVSDTIGAGDAFAAALAHGVVTGWAAEQIADFANRVGALVASRAGATPRWTMEEAAALRH